MACAPTKALRYSLFSVVMATHPMVLAATERTESAPPVDEAAELAPPIDEAAESEFLQSEGVIPTPTLIPSPSPDSSSTVESRSLPSSYYQRYPGTKAKGSTFWLPLASFGVPGLGPYIYGHSGWGTAYLGANLAANILGQAVYREKLLEFIESDSFADKSKEDQAYAIQSGELPRKYALTQQVDFASRSFSAWHTFRLAAETRRPFGEYAFLENDETPADVMLAPFDFSHLKKWTTFVPMTMIGVSYLVTMQALKDSEKEIAYKVEGHEGRLVKDPFTRSDAFFAGSVSYLAGTHEEVLFRGWLLPLTMQAWNSRWWANAFISGIFGLAHLGPGNPFPLPQLLLGWHLGYVTQKRQMTLAESVFIHTWWDVVAFAATYQIRQINGSTVRVPPLWLPPLNIEF